ncbi:MAG TPA: class B sortase [Oscillospiraceae bacterium]|nr:class B sortase [Oscillospiraceae bacterium]HNW05369.1 class B sortase [Oscillospiraceae bacterium]HPV99834.1 class B sortase [Oscillospiraceae bacterium]
MSGSGKTFYFRLVLPLTALAALILLSGAAETSAASAGAGSSAEAEIAAGEAAGGAAEGAPEEGEPAYSYNYLRGTRYRNLLLTRYQNLAETLVAEEPAAEAAAATASARTAIAGAGAAYAPVDTTSGFSSSLVARLSVSGTNIQDYPIYQNTGSTNYYAGSKWYYAEMAWAAATAYLSGGSLSQNTVIYGHNWRNCFVPFSSTGGQFEPLMAFTYSDFATQNQYIYLTTNGATYTFRIFAVAFTTNLNFYINCNGIDVSSVAAKAQNLSMYDYGVGVGSSDKLLTLSTCTRYFSGMGANQRFIVMAKLVS